MKNFVGICICGWRRQWRSCFGLSHNILHRHMQLNAAAASERGDVGQLLLEHAKCFIQHFFEKAANVWPQDNRCSPEAAK